MWSGCSKEKIKDLFILQKRAVKYILNVPFLSSSSQLFTKEFISLPSLCNIELLKVIYKLINNELKNSFEFNKINQIHIHNTRRTSNYYIEKFKTNMQENSVINRGLILFNKLNHEIKDEKIFSNFKKTIKLNEKSNYIQNFK